MSNETLVTLRCILTLFILFSLPLSAPKLQSFATMQQSKFPANLAGEMCTFQTVCTGSSRLESTHRHSSRRPVSNTLLIVVGRNLQEPGEGEGGEVGKSSNCRSCFDNLLVRGSGCQVNGQFLEGEILEIPTLGQLKGSCNGPAQLRGKLWDRTHGTRA
jgi:hypothetical protein